MAVNMFMRVEGANGECKVKQQYRERTGRGAETVPASNIRETREG